MSSKEQPVLRVWPGIAIVALQWIVTLGSGLFPGTPLQGFGMMGGPAGGLLLVLIWWLFGSRTSWPERGMGSLVLILGILAGFVVVDPSVGFAMFVWGVPFACTAFVLGVFLTRADLRRRRLLAVTGAVLAVVAVFAGLRSEGVRGDMSVDFAPRWSATAEDRLVAAAGAPPAPGAQVGDAPAWDAAGWPEFRGPRRDGVLPGVTIAADWAANPPEQVWKRPVGPGWGSFAVAGGRLYTQEQRGEKEVVACYDAASGEPIWLHQDTARFWEALGGPGPRATPTVHQGRVYAFGATGILNALDAADGSPVWTRDAAADTGAALPTWGFASSPLIVDDLVMVHTGAGGGKGLVAYDLADGTPRWFSPVTGASYTSAHLVTLHGVRQVVVLTADGATSVAPETGELLWVHAWPMDDGARIVQPAFTADGDMLIGTGFGMGVQRVRLDHSAGGWVTEAGWTSTGLKPYFNDFVVHDGHAYGFDGRIMACIDLTDGSRSWKGGRYGHGQALLLADQGVILVLSEEGDLALIRATPERFVELGRVPALQGKTWNHPVLVDGTVYLRNAEEMAAYRLGSGAALLSMSLPARQPAVGGN